MSDKKELTWNEILVFILVCVGCWIIFSISNTEPKSLADDNKKIVEEK